MKWYFILLLILLGVCVILCVGIVFLSKTGSNKKVLPYEWLFQSPIAHRGYHLNNQSIPENSSIAFTRAIEKNYLIETDLNLTKDHKVVVFHDGTLQRMCNDHHRVIEKTMDEIKQMKLQDGEYSPMELSEFLQLVDGKVGLLIEFKGEGKEINRILCEEAMKILKNYQGKWVMQSFQPGILKWFLKNYPTIPRGQLCHNYLPTKEERKNKKGKEKQEHSYLSRWLFTYMFANFIGRPNFISREWSSMNFMVRSLHRKHVPLLMWTVNTHEAYEIAKNEADNMIFEYLDLDQNGNIRK